MKPSKEGFIFMFMSKKKFYQKLINDLYPNYPIRVQEIREQEDGVFIRIKNYSNQNIPKWKSQYVYQMEDRLRTFTGMDIKLLINDLEKNRI